MREKIKKFKFRISRGFTLLEILVVISIIGIVLGLASVSYSTSQIKARNSKRVSDLKAIQNAFEQYYANCGYEYPTTAPSVGAAFTDCNGSTLITSFPGDPKSGADYTAVVSATAYSITAAEVEGGITPPVAVNLQ